LPSSRRDPFPFRENTWIRSVPPLRLRVGFASMEVLTPFSWWSLMLTAFAAETSIPIMSLRDLPEMSWTLLRTPHMRRG